jgi:hypothetical protein
MKKEKKVFYTPKDEVERYNIGSIDLLNYNNGGCLMFGKLEKSGRFFLSVDLKVYLGWRKSL